jgi:hypothetical protein
VSTEGSPENPSDDNEGDELWKKLNLLQLPPESVDKMRYEAIGKVVRNLLPHMRGAFLIGTSVSGSDQDWSGFQLTTNENDNLMLATMMPSEMSHWTRASLQGQLETDMVTISSLRGQPKESVAFMRALHSSVAGIKEFFERYILIGHFVTEFDCLEPVVYAHRPEGESLIDFLRQILFAVNYSCSGFLRRYGFTQDRTIMQLAHDHVEDLVDLFPDPASEDAAEYLRRMLLDGVPFELRTAIPHLKWTPGFGDLPPLPQE